MTESLVDIAARVQQAALRLGADECTIDVSRSTSSEMSQRKGKIEKSKQSRSLSISAQLLVDQRYSVHSASDPRPAAIEQFLSRAIAATRYLEKDEHRGLPERHRMGFVEPQKLEINDQSWQQRTPPDRRQQLESLENACLHAGKDSPVRSITAWVWDAHTSSHTLCSNGYEAGYSRSQFGMGSELTLEDNERLPEAYDFYSARYAEDLPTVDTVAQSLLKRGTKRLGSGAIASAQLPMLLENRAAARILNVFLGPLNGTAIYEKRSCLLDKLEQKIAPEGLSIISDPLIPRGLSSFSYDGDGLAARRIPLLEQGFLRNYLIGIYNSRRLACEPTSSSTGNIIIPTGQQSPQQILNSLPRAISVEGFLGGNTNPISGDYSFGITGTLYEHGKAIQGVSEMNISGNLFDLLMRWQAAANDPWKFSGYSVPSLLFDAIQFSGR